MSVEQILVSIVVADGTSVGGRGIGTKKKGHAPYELTCFSSRGRSES